MYRVVLALVAGSKINFCKPWINAYISGFFMSQISVTKIVVLLREFMTILYKVYTYTQWVQYS